MALWFHNIVQEWWMLVGQPIWKIRISTLQILQNVLNWWLICSMIWHSHLPSSNMALFFKSTLISANIHLMFSLLNVCLPVLGYLHCQKTIAHILTFQDDTAICAMSEAVCFIHHSESRIDDGGLPSNNPRYMPLMFLTMLWSIESGLNQNSSVWYWLLLY